MITTEQKAPARLGTAPGASNSEHAQNINSTDRLQPKFREAQERAERDGIDLIAAACEYGRDALHGLQPREMPTQQQAQVLARVLDQHDKGIRGWPDMVLAFGEDYLRSVIKEAGDAVLPMNAAACKPLVERLRAFDCDRRCRVIGDRIQRKITDGDDINGDLDELAAIRREYQEGTSEDLLTRAYSMRYRPDEEPPPDELCMTLGDDHPIAARGNITVIQGKSKVGKSAVVAAVLGAAQRGLYYSQADTLRVQWVGDATGAILHCDTEQSRADWHALVTRSVIRSGIAEVSPRLVSLPMVMFSRSERLEILRQALKREQAAQGRVDLVVVDGVADLCTTTMDEADALELVSVLHALSQEHDCAMVVVIHENPSSETGKSRGHLGSELNRKAFANLRLDKDAETSVTTIYGTDMRKRDLPKEQGFCFGWDDAAQMHLFKGRAAGMKAAQLEAVKTTKARAYWEPIFAHVADLRENPAFPGVTIAEACEADREISGNKESTKPEAMKKRLQSGEGLGILEKNGKQHWRYLPAGTPGNLREKGK